MFNYTEAGVGAGAEIGKKIRTRLIIQRWKGGYVNDDNDIPVYVNFCGKEDTITHDEHQQNNIHVSSY